MIPIVTPKDGMLLEQEINKTGHLKKTHVSHDPNNYSILAIKEFQYTIPTGKRDNLDVKTEYYSKLQASASDLGADMIQIIKESSQDTQPQPWGIEYETMITMYVKKHS